MGERGEVEREGGGMDREEKRENKKYLLTGVCELNTQNYRNGLASVRGSIPPVSETIPLFFISMSAPCIN